MCFDKKSQAASFAKITRTGAGKEKENATISYESLLGKLSFISRKKGKVAKEILFNNILNKMLDHHMVLSPGGGLVVVGPSSLGSSI